MAPLKIMLSVALFVFCEINEKRCSIIEVSSIFVGLDIPDSGKIFNTHIFNIHAIHIWFPILLSGKNKSKKLKLAPHCTRTHTHFSFSSVLVAGEVHLFCFLVVISCMQS